MTTTDIPPEVVRSDKIKALQRVDLVSQGASPFDVYGTEWAIDPTFAFRRDLRVLIGALLEGGGRALAQSQEVL